VDNLTAEKRSWNMSRIKGIDTKPEVCVRSLLHRLGYRFRLHRRELPGRPDIVMPKYKTVIFVHGCFWHRHDACKYAYVPKSRNEFWERKFEENVERDKRNRESLKRMGWSVEIIWECETRNPDSLLKRICNIFQLQNPGNAEGD